MRTLYTSNQRLNNFFDQAVHHLLNDDILKPVRALSSVGVLNAVDIIENKDSYTLLANVPGVSKDRLTIDIDGTKITLQVSELKPQEKTITTGNEVSNTQPYSSHPQSGNQNYILKERSPQNTYASRTFDLEEVLEAASAKASFDDGVLTVTVEKKRKEKNAL